MPHALLDEQFCVLPDAVLVYRRGYRVFFTMLAHPLFHHPDPIFPSKISFSPIHPVFLSKDPNSPCTIPSLSSTLIDKNKLDVFLITATNQIKPSG
jgi:hypothetical protein